MSDTSKAQAESTQPTQQKKSSQVLEEDDEFEDFPVEGEIRLRSSVPLATLELCNHLVLWQDYKVLTILDD